MNAQQIAKIIKSLSKMQQHEREEIEDVNGTFGCPFYSGLISYSKTPVADAIECYESFIRDWQTVGAQREFPQDAPKAIARAEQMLALLRA